MRALVRIVMSFVFTWNFAVAQVNLDSGQRSYEVCAGCHGFLGEGNALVNAPRVAGLEDWYLSRQMQNFSAGIRGYSDDDPHGQRMATMAQAVLGDRARDDVVAYIGTLPITSPSLAAIVPEAVAGDLEQGRRAYAICAACHGAEGEGNETMMSPALALLDDWYVVEQLRLYAEQLRGAHANDTYGQQMRALAGSFSDEHTRRDLAVYIRSLNR